MAHIYGHTWPVRWGDDGETKMVKVYSNCFEAELFLNGKSLGVKKRNSQDFPAAGLRWNTAFVSGENRLKVLARKGGDVVIDEILFQYQTEKWSAPAKMVFEKIAQQGDTVTLQVKFLDKNGVQCLDARNYAEFIFAGDGKLLDNLGTSSGSRKVQAYNGRAIIRAVLNGKQAVVGVKSEGMETVMIKL
jgi:beta-galactosidase